MNIIDKPLLRELYTGDYTHYEIQTALCVIHMMDDNGCFLHFSPYRVAKLMIDQMDWLHRSSIERAMSSLISRGFFESYEVSVAGETVKALSCPGLGDGLIKSDENYTSKGFIKLHDFLYKRIFFKKSLRAKRMILNLLLIINNSTVRSIPYNFKSNKRKDRFHYICEWLKVNRLAHVVTTINEIQDLFTIVKKDHNTYFFGLNGVSGAIMDGVSRLMHTTTDQVKKVESIIKSKNRLNQVIKPEEIRKIAEAMGHYGMKLKRQVIDELMAVDFKSIDYIYSYTKAIVERLLTDIGAPAAMMEI